MLDEHHQLAEDLAQVAAIDFIDDEDIVVIRIARGAATEVVEQTVLKSKAARLGGAISLYEILVGV